MLACGGIGKIRYTFEFKWIIDFLFETQNAVAKWRVHENAAAPFVSQSANTAERNTDCGRAEPV